MSETLTRNFTHITIPAEIWLRKDISMQSKCLWAEIRSLHDKLVGGCYASDEYLMEFLNLKRSRLYELYKELKESRLLEMVSFNGRKTIRKALVPEIEYECGQQVSGKPDSSSPENRTAPVRKTGLLSYIENKEENKERERVGCAHYTRPEILSTSIYQTEQHLPKKSFESQTQHNIHYHDQNINKLEINKSEIKTNPNKKTQNNNYGPPDPTKIERRPNIFTTQQEHEKLVEACKEKKINLEEVYDFVSSWKLNNPEKATKRKSDYLMANGWGITAVREKTIKEQELNVREERLKNPIKGRAYESVKDDIRRENNAKWIKANGDPNDDPNILRFK